MRLRKVRLKGLLCTILSGVMIMASVAPASAATARATTMKLEKTEGTVTLKTQNGSARKISNGMRLYNGNTLTTEKYSYAYVNLDDTKAVKLDQSSSATLRQSGNQLELLVKSGKLFFNVSKKLDYKESMNVRTSTMVTGVRGTCGVVEYVDQNKSKLYLIEGRVTLGSGENATVVEGGQTATVVLQPKQETGGSEQPGGEDKPGETEKPGETDKEMEQKVMVEKLTEKTIPPVALQEIVANPVLQEKIEKTTELKIEKIEEALEQFEKEEAERIEQEKAEEEKENEKEETKEPEKKPDEQQPTNGSSSSSDSGGSYTPTTPSQPVVKEISLEGPVTSGAIIAAFTEYDWVHVGFKTSKTATLSLQAGETLEIPGGKTLILWGKQELSNNAEIKVGNGALLCVPEGASLIGDNANIKMASGSTLETHGSLKIKNMISDGGATIKNTGMIDLVGAYTYASSAAGDKYSDDEDALLLSRSQLTAMPSGSLLMYPQSSTETTESPGLYYYASAMGKNVIDNMNLASGQVTWKFEKNAVLPAGDIVELSGFHAQMNGNELQVKGTLTLSGATNITGSGASTVKLVSGGNLILSDKNSSTDAVPVIENTGTGYAIARDGGTLTWKDRYFTIWAAKGLDHAIQGVLSSNQTAETGITVMKVPDHVTLDDQIAIVSYGDGVLELMEVPQVFDDSSAELNVESLNVALQKYDTVTVKKSEVLTGQVTVPEGRTLNVEAPVTGSETSGYKVGLEFMETGGLLLKGNAKVTVSGWLFAGGGANIVAGDGTSQAQVEIASGGSIMMDQLKLNHANIINNGTIDGGSISSVGGSTITNNALIKLSDSYQITSADAGDTYSSGEKGSGVLISDQPSAGTQDDGIIGALDETAELAHAGGTTADGTTTLQQYYYADNLNACVAKYMNQKTASGASITFNKDAVILKDTDIELNNLRADMGTNQLQVEGNLTLTDVQAITGSGKAVIYLTGDGSLTLGGTVKGTISNMATNTATDTGYYAIAASDDTLKSQKKRLFWKNVNLTICSKKSNRQDTTNPYIIQGYNKDENDDLIPGEYAWVQYMDGYKACIDNNNYEEASLVKQ